MPTSPLPNSAVSLLPAGFITEVPLVLLSLPQAARKAVSAVEPPPITRNLRLDWGPASRLISAIAWSPSGRLPAHTYGDGDTGGSESPDDSNCIKFPTQQRGNLMQFGEMAGGRTRGAALLTLGSIVSVQSGAALATGLFDSVGPAGAVFLRAGFGATALLLLTRGAPLRTREWPHRDVWLLSVAVAAVNLFFYAALDRLPLGITVTLEFVGPLGVAVLGSRRPRDVLWVLLAATGIVLLSGGCGGGIDGLGVALALSAGFFWGAYILLSARVGAIA